MANATTVPATTKPEANLPAISGPRLPFHPLVEQRFGIDRASWKALVEVIFLGATTVESIILALSYCKARKLDPFKKNVHIVPVWNSQLGRMVDTIWPGIGELRTTAFRTGEYAGRGETVFGPDITEKVGKVEITYPEWAQVTVKRMIRGQIVEFCGPRVYWIETYAVKKRDDDSPNQMWQDRPRGQIDKCAEAAALRAAFPEEIGGDISAEEINPFMRGGTSVTVESKNAMDEITAKLEAAEVSAPIDLTPENSEEVNSPETPDSSPRPAKWQAWDNLFTGCDSKLDADGIRKACVKEIDDPDDEIELERLYAECLERISASRGANSNGKGGK
jgi:phage recombination protein Bet